MSMSDPIADLLTRIRNAQMVNKSSVKLPSSTIKVAIVKVLIDEGYISSYQLEEVDGKKYLSIDLKYYEGKPVIELIKRISRPGLRIYKSKDDLPSVMGGLGISVVSTSQGIMSDKSARSARQGGEIICVVA
jgi:small subunit ribosomal protein S8